LLADGASVESGKAIAAAATGEFSDLPALHPFRAQLQRMRGLLALQQGDLPAARQSLQKALVLCESLYGPADWRSERVRQELLHITH
jgi:hypothetical protein